MPQGDRTGPMGQGSMTGRRMGFCQGNDTPGNTKGIRDGMGRGRGLNRRINNSSMYNWEHLLSLLLSGITQFYPRSKQGNKEEEKQEEIKILKLQSEKLNQAQNNIEKRIEELEK